MESEGEIPISSLGHLEVSTPCTIKKQEYPFPPKGSPYMGSIPTSVHPELPCNYVTLAQLVLGMPTASSLYHNPIWAFGAMPTIGPFIHNLPSQQKVISIVTSVPVQPTIPNPLVSSIQATRLVQLTISSHVDVSSSIPLVSGQAVPPPVGKSLNMSMMLGTANVSCPQTHMVGMN